MKRWHPLLLLLLNVFVAARAQKGKMEDVVYCKDESVYRGTIIHKNDHLLKLQMNDGSIRVFINDVVLKTSREPKYGSYSNAKPGFASYTELGPLVAGKTTIDGVTTAAFSFQTVNGYRFSRPFFAGAGIGADLYATQTVIPLFASIRGDLSAGAASVIPYYFADAGYGFNITQDSPGNTDFKGGLLYAAGLGLKIPFNRSAGFLIGFGYRYQATEYAVNGISRPVDYRRLAIRAGFFF